MTVKTGAASARLHVQPSMLLLFPIMRRSALLLAVESHSDCQNYRHAENANLIGPQVCAFLPPRAVAIDEKIPTVLPADIFTCLMSCGTVVTFLLRVWESREQPLIAGSGQFVTDLAQPCGCGGCGSARQGPNAGRAARRPTSKSLWRPPAGSVSVLPSPTSAPARFLVRPHP